MSDRPLTTLLAEDYLPVRCAIEEILLSLGFIVHSASDGLEGCKLIDKIKNDYLQLLITDVDMPGCCGEELAQYARRQFDQIKIIFMSGTPQASLLKMIASDTNARFLQKPFRGGKLLEVIKDLRIL